MAEIIITIENLRKIIQGLKAKGTDKVRVSIVDETLTVEDLKTKERAEMQLRHTPYAQPTLRRERAQFTKRR